MALFTVKSTTSSGKTKTPSNTLDAAEKSVAEKIKRRRLQVLVHSYIYYELNQNIITDDTWSRWAKELVELQDKYPAIAAKVCYAEAFKDFDASTGAFLPLCDSWVRDKAAYLLSIQHKFKEEL